ncbi:precorrin-6y C5,15-methyltransferase (decarboxylating) subunit CbiE [Streptomyces sp. AK02-01A]|uniref:precorrin-6y C5,15-methyltransferase (decarboxylating) subunit CbiE n=1 Tax=Streptomyces sp. AK02-01A TaxID=3028648 RepID=UPI0029B8DAE1|nr:precorrin-6y C5,15-methyltransferase (decarboxylating) subunit CbiE [Streptomyces sp. AK02-01A]MDX3851103.1 precorrin-6y C5,15-methyltransferase (decarboxylating) subunit CbiE [Streptomyces sp. AK02-01A]
MSPEPPAAPVSPVTVVGIGADGWHGLSDTARTALRSAEVLIGGARQLALLPADECAGERVPWPSPLRPAVPGLLAARAGRRISVLASGDPMFYGIGRALSEVLGAGALRVLPHPSSVSYACARLGWPVEDTEVVTLVGRPVEQLTAALHDGRRILVLSAGAATPAEVAALLRERGYGPSRMRVLEQLGAERERRTDALARDWAEPAGDALNVVAIECRRAPDALRLGAVPGLPDSAYEHDGQLTKRHVRAATLAALAPAPGESLWDIGGGSGSIAVEWMRTHRSCRAVSVERDPVRAERIGRNARALGVPGLRVVSGRAPAALSGLPEPDAVFIGGGLTAPGLLEACWDALPAGGRLVANTVTLESEALLADWYRRFGGELVRLAVAHAVPVGGFTGWRGAMPVTQWAVTKASPHITSGEFSGEER